MQRLSQIATLLVSQRNLAWYSGMLAWLIRYCSRLAAPGAAQLLQYLVAQAQIPEYQVRWRWSRNSVALWDNRSTQHYAVMDYPPCHRKMERAGIVGDLPY